MNQETPEENPPPPASKSSRPVSPPVFRRQRSSPLTSPTPRPVTPVFRRQGSSPLSSPMPSPVSNRILELDDVVMAPPPGNSGSERNNPNVLLIQPTPDNSQKNSRQVTQLHPTPQRPDEISTSGPAATLPASPLQTSTFAALTIVDTNLIPPVSILPDSIDGEQNISAVTLPLDMVGVIQGSDATDSRNGHVLGTDGNMMGDVNSEAIIEASTNEVRVHDAAFDRQVVDVEDTTTDVGAVEGVDSVEGVVAKVLDVASAEIPAVTSNAATLHQTAEIPETPSEIVENTRDVDVMEGVVSSEDVASDPNAATAGETAVKGSAAAVDDLSTQSTEEQQQSIDKSPAPPPILSLGPAARTRSHSRSQNPEGSTLGIPGSQPVQSRSSSRTRSLSPLPGGKRRAEEDNDVGKATKKRKT